MTLDRCERWVSASYFFHRINTGGELLSVCLTLTSLIQKCNGFYIIKKKFFYRNLLTFIGSFEQLDTCCLSCTLMHACIIGLQTMKELAALDGCMMVKETCKSFSFARVCWFYFILLIPSSPLFSHATACRICPYFLKCLDSEVLAS